MAEEARGDDTSGLSDARRAAWNALPRKFVVVLASVDTLLVFAYFALIALGRSEGHLFGVFNLDKEANLPSWFAGTQLFIIAAGFLLLGSRLVPKRDRVARLRPLWLVMGLGFTLLSADEVSSFHERMGTTLWRMKVFNIRFTDQWMVVYVLIGVALALALSPYLLGAWREWRYEVLLFLLGLGVLASGAFLAEVAQIYVKWQGVWHLVEIGVEEWLELLGATVLALPPLRMLSWAMTSDAENDAGQ